MRRKGFCVWALMGCLLFSQSGLVFAAQDTSEGVMAISDEVDESLDEQEDGSAEEGIVALEEAAAEEVSEESGSGLGCTIEMEDGEYAIEVSLEGGSGRASVTSPCILIVEEARAYAKIVWSSTYYDYMIVDGVYYYPINDDGNSTFIIPITVFNTAMDVIADTTAMSVPHEIEYTLTFDGESIMDKSATPQEAAKRVVYMVFVIIAACIVVSVVNKRRRLRKA